MATPRPKFVVPGCVRVTVPGLWGDGEWAALLEARLLQCTGVSEVRANPRTGRVLVLFDPSIVDYATIARLLEEEPETADHAYYAADGLDPATELVELQTVDAPRQPEMVEAIGH
jgi:ATP-binding cassette subfamily B protein